MSNDKSYILDENQMHLAETFDTILQDYDKEIATLQKEFQDKVGRMNEACKLEARKIWFEMADALGIDAVETWTSPSYFLDRTYISDGFAAIRCVKQTPNPLAHMANMLPGEKALEPSVKSRKRMN